jgi:hypothetical protein
MWRLTLRFFLGIFLAASFTNAAAVYLFHDVDADRVGNLNLAYRDLTLEFLVFGFVLTSIFSLLTWVGAVAFRLRDIPPNLKLGFILGMAVTILQYPGEFVVRKLTTEGSADSFLLGYMFLSPICCAVLILLNRHKRRTDKNAALG